MTNRRLAALTVAGVTVVALGFANFAGASPSSASPTVSPTVIDGGSCCSTTYTFTSTRTRSPRP